jgi:hypothetical protein
VCDASGNPIASNTTGIQVGGTSCKKIPSQLIDPFTSSLLKTFTRSRKYSFPGSTSNYSEDRANTDNAHSYQIKADHRLSARNNMWARFTNMYVSDFKSFTGTIEQAASKYHAYNWERV